MTPTDSEYLPSDPANHDPSAHITIPVEEWERITKKDHAVNIATEIIKSHIAQQPSCLTYKAEVIGKWAARCAKATIEELGK